uniref:Uncharacterized protein n=1 Tax=Anguilla anguilla TaxID=7936 RepID=A0A0E9U716_ANGAN
MVNAKLGEDWCHFNSLEGLSRKNS